MKARGTRLAALLVAIALLVFYLWSVMSYLAWPSFADQIEAHFAVQAQTLMAGGEIYPALNAANRGAMLYGPTGYLTNIPTMLLVADPVLGAKLSGALLALGTLALLAWRLRVLGGPGAAVWGVAFYLLVAISFANYSYWNRSDSLLLFGCTLAFAAALFSRPGVGVMLAGLGAGLAAGGKITAAVYFLPVAWIILRRWGWRWFALWVALAAVWTLLPFVLFEGISLPNYLDWLTAMAGHDLLASLAGKTIRKAALIIVPALLVLLATGRGAGERALLRDTSVQALILLGAALVLSVPPASKEGSGPHHILPLVPATALMAAWVWGRLGRDNKIPLSRRRALAIALLATAWFGLAASKSIKSQLNFRGYIARQDHVVEARRDLEEIRSRHADRTLAMGYAGGFWLDPEYQHTYLRPLLDTGENFLDAPALIDAQAAGISLPEATRRKMRSQPYDFFVIPRGGRPFSVVNRYSGSRGKSIFEDLGTVFLENYRLTESTDYFDIWVAIDMP